MIYSFDVFDTLITRLCSHPEAVFDLIADKLCNNSEYDRFDYLLRSDFKSHRKHAERLARRKYQNQNIEDISITQIYEQLALIFGLSSIDQQQLIKLELDTEFQLSVPISENINKIKSLLKQNERVILISDMYLRAGDIKRIIEKHSPEIANSCDLYVSSELLKTKHKGTIFPEILKDLKIEASELYHVGDNLQSDIKMAQKHGIKSGLYQVVPHNFDVSDVNEAIHLGILRYLTIEGFSKFQIIGVKYAMPLLLGFIEWLEAILPKNKQILFLARDGEMLLSLLKQLDSEKTSYSYCHISRQAAVLAAMNDFNNEFMDYLFQGYPFISMKILAERLHLSINEFCNSLQLSITNADKLLNNKKLQHIKQTLLNNKDFQQTVIKKAREQKRYLKEYINELNNDQKELYIVDLGWKGTIQQALTKIFESDINGYYWGLTEHNDNASAYYFYPSSGFPEELRRISIVFTELFCTSNTAVTKEYNQGGPVLSEKRAEKEWVKQLREVCSKYIGLYKSLSIQIDWATLTTGVLNELNKPTKEVASILGSLEYSADPLDRGGLELAPTIKTIEIFRKKIQIAWLPGRLKRTNFFKTYLFKLRFSLFSILRKILRKLR